jgi:hypothetical protein
MILTMYREDSVDGATLSKLYHGGDYICDILEDVVREEKGIPVAVWKVHGKTAIPAGTYEITLENSARFGPNTMTLKDVEGFEYIRIHGGNTAENTEGCLLTGSRNSSNTVAKSQIALANLKQLVVNAMVRDERVWIEICPPLALA